MKLLTWEFEYMLQGVVKTTDLQMRGKNKTTDLEMRIG